MSVDPTEALNKKYKELEEEYERKRIAVEEEIARNDEQVSFNHKLVKYRRKRL